MNKAIALAIALLAASPALAQSGGSDACPDVANDARGRACLQGLLQQSERDLASAWRSAFGAFGGSAGVYGRALLTEQRAWIAYKDKACGIYFMPGHRPMDWSNGMRCRRRIIAERIVELDRAERDLAGQD